MADFLMISAGICWGLAYIFIIRRSFKDKVYGMPIAACAANLSWEFIYSAVYPFSPPMRYINYIWLFIDIFIFLQILAFARSEFPNVPDIILTTLLVLSVPCAFILTYYAHHAKLYPVTSSFASNLMMSWLFIGMLIRRGNTSGQTIYIAILKCAGTLSVSILFYFIYRTYRHHPFMTPLYISIFAADLIYIWLLFVMARKEDKNPWTHW